MFTTLLLGLATITDILWRRIPNYLTYSFLSLGILLNLLVGNVYVLLTPLVFALFYILYRLGVLAGGDAKLGTALFALCPSPYPLLLFFAGGVLGGLLSLLYVLMRAWKEVLQKLYNSLPRILSASLVLSNGPLALPLLLLPLPMQFYAGLALFLVSRNIALLFRAFLLLLALDLILVLLSLRSSVFMREKPVDELKEGDVPAEFVTERGERIPLTWKTAMLYKEGKIRSVVNPFRAGGLEKMDIKELRKYVDRVRVRLTVPLVPFIFAAHLLFLWDPLGMWSAFPFLPSPCF